MAAISERGSDAAGYCYRGPGVDLTVCKQRSGASRLLDAIRVPHAAREGLIHVRDYTKGHPSIEANNHPIRHGSVVGIHNGIIRNDEEIFASHGFERAAPRMTVDSEAIFALVEAERSSAGALDELYGSMATAWMDERTPDTVYLARGMGRPLWVGEGREALFFASTKAALELVESYASVSLEKSELETGTLLTVAGGTVARREGFQPDLAFSEAPLPAVRAPEEHRSCLALLAALVAPAAARAAAR